MSTKIVCISDTHSYHRRVVVPDGDILIHAGDITWRGEIEIIADFCNWLQELPHKRKLIIFGNHELGMRQGPKRHLALQLISVAGATYLENNGVEIDGLLIYGSPATPNFMDWEWNYQRGKDIAMEWAKIPLETNILITHGPSYGVLDIVQDMTRGPQGCEELAKRIKQLPNLKAHICGHLHLGYGSKIIGQTVFVNAACCNDAYNPINPPIVIEV